MKVRRFKVRSKTD